MSPDPRPPVSDPTNGWQEAIQSGAVSDQTPTPERPWSCAVAACDQLEDPCTADRAHTACTVRNAEAAPHAPTPEPQPATECGPMPPSEQYRCTADEPCDDCTDEFGLESVEGPLSRPLPPTPSPVSPEDGEGVRSQTEQWFVVHHNQIRALRFAQFPIERLARASIAACTCGPHTLRHTVITTYTASDETEFVAARPSGAVS